MCLLCTGLKLNKKAKCCLPTKMSVPKQCYPSQKVRPYRNIPKCHQSVDPLTRSIQSTQLLFLEMSRTSHLSFGQNSLLNTLKNEAQSSPLKTMFYARQKLTDCFLRMELPLEARDGCIYLCILFMKYLRLRPRLFGQPRRRLAQ